MPDEPLVITGKKDIKLYHMRTQLTAMKLAEKGLHHSSGRSIHKFVKETYNLPGPRNKLVEQFEALIKQIEEEPEEK
jgi:hypothetical protein